MEKAECIVCGREAEIDTEDSETMKDALSAIGWRDLGDGPVCPECAGKA
jgi:rubredoxin